MGYDWMISVGIESYGNYDTENIVQEVTYVYKKLITQDIDYPILGSVVHNSSGYYHKDDELIQKLLKFTINFPEITFVIVYSSWDLRSVTVWKIKNDIVLSADQLDLGRVVLGSGVILHIGPKYVAGGNRETWDDIFEDFDNIHNRL